jgi:hypothetical protein
MLLESFVQVSTVKAEYEVADVFRRYGDAYRKKYHVSWEQRQAMRDIVNCRTAALGGYVEQCNTCARLRVHYCSCKNRNCPKCGAFEKAQWLARLQAKLLPIPYFHAVFTTDHAINGLARVSPRKIYNLLFRTAAKVLKAYGRKYLGGEIGFTMVLHTWSQTMTEHIHVHCIVTGGALQQTEEGSRWRSSKKTFLFPVEALSQDFRDAFCAGLLRLHRRGELKVAAEIAKVDVEALVKRMQSKRWEVFIKPAPADPKRLCDYLGKYAYRIAISNYRIVSIERGRVRFKYYDNVDSTSPTGKEKVMELPALEFMRRFLLHVLPGQFVRIRHYGLHHSSKQGDLEVCRGLLGLPKQQPEAPRLELVEWLRSFLPEGQDPRQCPFCEAGRMFVRNEFGPLSSLKSGLLSLLGIPARGAVG